MMDRLYEIYVVAAALCKALACMAIYMLVTGQL